MKGFTMKTMIVLTISLLALSRLLAGSPAVVAVHRSVAPEIPAPAYTISKLPAAGADFLLPIKINLHGEVLGSLDFSSGPFLDNAHVGLFSGGTTIDLHLLTLGAEPIENSLPIGLNDHGQVIFFADDDLPSIVQFFLYDDGQLVNLNALYGTDDLEFLTAVYGETDFLYAGGRLRLFDSSARDNEVPAPFVVAGINHRGDAVGSSMPFSLDSHALLFSGGRAYDLHDLIDPTTGWRLIYAFDINDHGQIVGWGRVDGNWAGFLLDPIRPAR
jgi:hypothetical protein